MKLRYEVPPDKVRKGIRWLEVVEGDGGAFVFQYEDINSQCKWDSFFANIEEALSSCEEDLGVRRSDWYKVS
jgi:hypothetical protein